MLYPRNIEAVTRIFHGYCLADFGFNWCHAAAIHEENLGRQAAHGQGYVVCIAPRIDGKRYLSRFAVGPVKMLLLLRFKNKEARPSTHYSSSLHSLSFFAFFFQVFSWTLTVTAFILIFVDIGGWVNDPISENPHPLICCITTGNLISGSQKLNTFMYECFVS